MAKLYLPNIRNHQVTGAAGDVCGMNAHAVDFAIRWLHHDEQRRRGATCDPRLVQAAQGHADDLAAHNYASHTGSDGRSPNQRVRDAGYRLPDWFPAVGNQVESISVRWQGVAENLKRLLESPGHRTHVLGEGFFTDQTVYGIGWAEGGWLVLVTCPPEGGDA